MSTAAGGLRELHQLHLQLASVQEQLDRGPRQVDARVQFRERKQGEVDEQKNVVIEFRKAADERNLQLKTNEAKIEELKRKLNNAASNREFDILKGQIDADTVANSVLEDEVLEILEKIDGAQQELANIERELGVADREHQRVNDEVSEARPGHEQVVEQLTSSIREAESLLPGSVADNYRRLIGAHGAGAMAAVENQSCTACYVAISPQTQVDLNSGEIVFCMMCGRLLYRPDSPEVAVNPEAESGE